MRTRHLTTEELAERLRRHPQTIKNWRRDNLGPDFMQVGSTILYPEPWVEEWEQARRRRSGTAA
jgi:Helix-turn-helix domain